MLTLVSVLLLVRASYSCGVVKDGLVNCTCTDEIDGYIYDCKTLNWTEVNDGFPVNTQKIMLQHNLIGYLSSSDFKNITNLRRLSVSYNQITTVDPDTFEKNSQLKYLFINYNKIDCIPNSTFHSSSNLEVLGLMGNQIEHLPPELVAKNEKLSKLLLSQNRIVHIPIGFLDNNNLLREVYINNNEIESVPETLLHQNEDLNILELSANRIDRLPENLLSRNSKLKKLFLDNNRITSIPDGFFDKNTFLEEINLSHNPISSIPTDLMNKLLNPLIKLNCQGCVQCDCLNLTLWHTVNDYLHKYVTTFSCRSTMVRLDVEMGAVPCPDTYGEFVSIGYTLQPNCTCPLLTLIRSVETKSTSTSSSLILQKTPSVTVPTSTYQSVGQQLETDLPYYSISSALKMRTTILIYIFVLQAVIVG